MPPPCGRGLQPPRGRPGSWSRASPQRAPNSPPHHTLALRPAAGGVRGPLGAPGFTLFASRWKAAWRRGLDDLPPEWPAGRCGPGPGGALHLYAPGGPAAPPPPPPRGPGLAGEGRRLGSLPRAAEPPRSSAGGASFPRPLRLAPLFSPGPLRPAAEPRRPLRSARGCAPGTRRRGRAGTLPAGLGPSALPGKGACPGARGRQPAEGQQGARSLRVSSERCAPRLGAHCPLPSPALYLFPFFPRTYSPSFPHFPLPRFLFILPSLCLFASSASSLSLLPCLSPSPLPFCLFLPLPFLSFLFAFSCSPFLSPSLPFRLLFPSRYPVSHSSSPSSLLVPPPALVPRLPSGFPLQLPSSLGGQRTGRCVSALGKEGWQPQLPEGCPPGGEGGDSSGKGPLSSSLPEAPPGHPLSQTEVLQAGPDPL